MIPLSAVAGMSTPWKCVHVLVSIPNVAWLIGQNMRPQGCATSFLIVVPAAGQGEGEQPGRQNGAGLQDGGEPEAEIRLHLLFFLWGVPAGVRVHRSSYHVKELFGGGTVL